MHKHFVQFADAVTQRGQVYNFVAQTTHLQLYAYLDQLAVKLGCLKKHNAQVQVHSFRMGVAKLSSQDER